MKKLAFLLVDTGGALDEAQHLAEHTLQKAPKEPDYADTLGLVYLKKNLADSALQVFRNVVKRYPDNPGFRFHYGLALLESGQKAQAQAELESALAKKPRG